MSEKPYQPPFTLTGEIVTLVADIAEQVGRLSANPGFKRNMRLRRRNRIRSIAGSLAIEGNTLTEAQIADILDGKPVLASPRELREARNAVAAYEQLPDWDGLAEGDLLAAHGILMLGLLDRPGAYRRGGLGIMAGEEVIHVAPPAKRVPGLMEQLLRWLRDTPEHPLIASSVFHYEFEFIHPFSDGNGRTGRLWQTLLLSRWNPAFAWLPVEGVVHERKAAYYRALQESTHATDAAPFIRYILGCIQTAVGRSTKKTTGKTIGKTIGKTPDVVLALLVKKPQLTVPELANRLGKSELTVHRAIRVLREAGRLRRIGPDKGGHWEVTGNDPPRAHLT